MKFKLSLFLLLSCSLFAAEYLQSNYFVKDNFVMLSDIVQNPKIDKKLFDIDKNKHTKRVKEKEILKTLLDNGYDNFSAKHSYVQFSKKSPIDTSKLKSYIENFYKQKYKEITIEDITISPRSYIEKLPKLYEIGSDKDIYLTNSGIFFIKTIDNKKIFFNYTIRAKITVVQSTNEMRRGTELSNLNTNKKSIMLDKFRAMPIQNLQAHTLELKHKVKSATILTKRDVVGLYLVKCGSKISVTLIDEGVSISFVAEASQSGRYGDAINAVKSNGKKIKVVITGRNRAEMK
jgi:flagella basal body P-ring formation protein FlgA